MLHAGLFFALLCPLHAADVPAFARRLSPTDYHDPMLDCVEIVNELMRQWPVPKTLVGNEADTGYIKHTPYMGLKDSSDLFEPRAWMITGDGAINDGGITHPMTDSSDNGLPHFISFMFVLDQADGVAALRRLSPHEPAPASFEFDIPAGTTKLTPYSYCNVHGLYVGATMDVPKAGTKPRSCQMHACNDMPACEAEVQERVRDAGYLTRAEVPVATDADNKHKPFLRIENGMGLVEVGKGNMPDTEAIFEGTGTNVHPIGVGHWIDLLYVLDQNDEVVTMRDLNSYESVPAMHRFAIPAGVTSLTPYEHCNLHGLYRGDVVAVPDSTQAENIVVGAEATCELRTCVREAPAEEYVNPDIDCVDLATEYFRLQESIFGTLAPNQPTATNVKHTPFLDIKTTAFADPRAYIVVGDGSFNDQGISHPMDVSDGDGEPHWINAIFALDQNQNVAAFRRLSATDSVPASFDFDIPAGVESLTPYQYCNKHGLYQGESIDVAQTSANLPTFCALEACASMDPCDNEFLEKRRLNRVLLAMGAKSQQDAQLPSNAISDIDVADDAADGKHKPYLRMEDGMALIEVGIGNLPDVEDSGSNIHPMGDGHWIELIWAVDQNDEIVSMVDLNSAHPSPAKHQFSIPEGVTSLTPYEYCNKHGLFKGDTVTVDTAANVFPGSKRHCGLRTCVGKHMVLPEVDRGHDPQSDCVDIVTEIMRDNPVFSTPDETNHKHTPFMGVKYTTIHPPRAWVTVGDGFIGVGGIDHPMTDNADGDYSDPHWISEIWVVDQYNQVAAMRRLTAQDPSPASFEFDVPAGTTELTPWQFCNKHGLFTGATITIEPDSVDHPKVAGKFCEIHHCKEMAACEADKFEQYRKNAGASVGGSTGTSAPDDIEVSADTKHRPYLMIDSGVGVVVVGVGETLDVEPIYEGDGTNVHPMGSPAHWIDRVWVTDQDGALVAMRDINSAEPVPAQIKFSIPEGVTSLTPWEHCNKHGLHKGTTVVVDETHVFPGSKRFCHLRACFGAQAIVPEEIADDLDDLRDCADIADECFRIQNGATDSSAYPIPPITAAMTSNTKHIPFMGVVDTDITHPRAWIIVGDGSLDGDRFNPDGLTHPMTDADDLGEPHWISVIFALDQNDVVISLRRLASHDATPASHEFEIPGGVTAITPYAYCNKHGLHQGSTMIVETESPLLRTCAIHSCNDMPACNNDFTEWKRVQVAEDMGAALEVSADEKHRPFLQIEEGLAVVHIGIGAVDGLEADDPDKGLIHPMSNVHWIDRIIVTDQNDDIVFMRDLSSWEGMPATARFGIPAGVTSLTPYEHCNIHGLHKGDTVAVAQDGTMTWNGAVRSCQLRSCAAPQIDWGSGYQLSELELLDKYAIQRIEASTDRDNAEFEKAAANYQYNQWIHPHYQIAYTINWENKSISMQLGARGTGWLGFGFQTQDQHAMEKTDMVLGWVDDDGTAHATDRWAVQTKEPRYDTDQTPPGTDDLYNVSGFETNTSTFIRFSRAFEPGDDFDANLDFLSKPSKIKIVWSFEVKNNDPYETLTGGDRCEYHGPTSGYANMLWNRNCDPGYWFSEEDGCRPCLRGEFRSADMPLYQCERCALGAYATEEAAVICDLCYSGKTTMWRGSESRDDCVCPIDTFASYSTKRIETMTGELADPFLPEITGKPVEGESMCWPCVPGTYCPGGDLLPLILKGYSAVVDPPEALVDGALSKDRLEKYYAGEIPADRVIVPGLFIKLKVWKCLHGYMGCPGRDIETPLAEVPRVKDARMIYECAGGLGEQGCSVCGEDRYVGSGAKCVECDAFARAILPCFFIITALGVVVLYRFMRRPESQKLTSLLILSCMMTIMMNFVQTLGVISMYGLQLPDILDGIFSFMRIFLFDISVLRVTCVMGVSFASRYLTVTLGPLLLFALLWIGLAGSHIIGYFRPSFSQVMGVDNLVNACGLVICAVYISLSRNALGYFECTRHPTATATLLVYGDVDCGSAEQTDLTVAAVFAVLIHVVMVPAVVLYGCFVAPKDRKLSQATSFFKKTVFLFRRWSPDLWYFTPVIMVRNLCFVFVTLLFPADPPSQLGFTVCVTLSYVALQSRVKPWRDDKLNYTDAFLGCCLVTFCMYGGLTTEAIISAEKRQILYLPVLMASLICPLINFGMVFFLVFAPKMDCLLKPKLAHETSHALLVMGNELVAAYHSKEQEKRFDIDGNQIAYDQHLSDMLAIYLTQNEMVGLYKTAFTILHEIYHFDLDIDTKDKDGIVSPKRMTTSRLMLSPGGTRRTLDQSFRQPREIRGSASSLVGGSVQSSAAPNQASSIVTTKASVAGEASGSKSLNGHPLGANEDGTGGAAPKIIDTVEV